MSKYVLSLLGAAPAPLVHYPPQPLTHVVRIGPKHNEPESSSFDWDIRKMVCSRRSHYVFAKRPTLASSLSGQILASAMQPRRRNKSARRRLAFLKTSIAISHQVAKDVLAIPRLRLILNLPKPHRATTWTCWMTRSLCWSFELTQCPPCVSLIEITPSVLFGNAGRPPSHRWRWPQFHRCV